VPVEERPESVTFEAIPDDVPAPAIEDSGEDQIVLLASHPE
jgi:hypothetical protein